MSGVVKSTAFNCHPCQNPKCNRMAGKNYYCDACMEMTLSDKFREEVVEWFDTPMGAHKDVIIDDLMAIIKKHLPESKA